MQPLPPLTPEELATFARDGCLCKPGVLDPALIAGALDVHWAGLALAPRPIILDCLSHSKLKRCLRARRGRSTLYSNTYRATLMKTSGLQGNNVWQKLPVARPACRLPRPSAATSRPAGTGPSRPRTRLTTAGWGSRTAGSTAAPASTGSTAPRVAVAAGRAAFSIAGRSFVFRILHTKQQRTQRPARE